MQPFSARLARRFGLGPRRTSRMRSNGPRDIAYRACARCGRRLHRNAGRATGRGSFVRETHERGECLHPSRSTLRSRGSPGYLRFDTHQCFVSACGSEHFSSKYGTRAANIRRPAIHSGCQSSEVTGSFQRGRAQASSASQSRVFVWRGSTAHLEKTQHASFIDKLARLRGHGCRLLRVACRARRGSLPGDRRYGLLRRYRHG